MARVSRRGGFTLVELLVVIAIMAIVAVIGFSMDGWENRSQAESKVQQVYSDLMNARERAITQKRWVFVIFAKNNNVYGYNIYLDTSPVPDGDGAYEAGQDTRVGPNWNLPGQIAMRVNNKQDPFQLNISPNGILTGTGTIHMQSSTPPQLNCIAWSTTDISLGTWDTNKNVCNPD